MSFLVVIEHSLTDIDRWTQAFAEQSGVRLEAGLSWVHAAWGVDADEGRFVLTLRGDDKQAISNYVEQHYMQLAKALELETPPSIFVGEMIPSASVGHGRLELLRDEAEELVKLVRERLGELSSEIHHSTVSSFQDALKRRKQRLTELMEKARRLTHS
ncbi:MAG: hypothetical protein H6707_00800 [Deltaproteobacteria bacterium]|nr:hypothetical protein [Deltaproteobacteria bacterium]